MGKGKAGLSYDDVAFGVKNGLSSHVAEAYGTHFNDAGGRSQSMTLKLESGFVKVAPDDDNAAAKALFALTVIRGSFQFDPPLDEKAAARRVAESTGLDVPDLPAGYYVVSPSGKIASAMIPSIDGEASGVGFFTKKRMAALSAAGIFEDDLWVTEAVFDPDKLLSRSGMFSDALETGVGAKESLERCGVMITCSRSSDQTTVISGYPASWRCKPVGIGILQREGGEDADGLEEYADICGGKVPAGLANGMPGVSVRLRLADLAAIPLFNHNGVSGINNARDIREVDERESERLAIFEHFVKYWMLEREALRGDSDGLFGSAATSLERLKALRVNEVRMLRRQQMGDARKVLCKNSVSSGYGGAEEGGFLILSADMALVDGQHSTRDYYLIASGLGLCGERAPDEPPKYLGESAKNCSRDALFKAFVSILEKNKGAAISRELRTDSNGGPSAEDLRLYGLIFPEKGERGTKGKELLESLFTEFTTSVSMRETNIQVDPVAADKDARLQVLAANSKAALAKADEAMNAHYAGIERFVDEFNETAMSLGDKARLHHAKSLHNNPCYSTQSAPSIGFSDVFPALLAVSGANPWTVTTGTKADKGNPVEAVRSWAVTEAAAYMARRDPSLLETGIDTNGDEFQTIRKRFVIYLGALEKLKGSGFSMTPANAESFLKVVYGSPDERESKQKNLVKMRDMAFSACARLVSSCHGIAPDLMERIKAAQGSLKEMEGADTASGAYFLGKAAIELKAVMNDARMGRIGEVFTKERFENVVFTLIKGRQSQASKMDEGIAPGEDTLANEGLMRIMGDTMARMEGAIRVKEASVGGVKTEYNSIRERFFGQLAKMKKEGGYYEPGFSTEPTAQGFMSAKKVVKAFNGSICGQVFGGPDGPDTVTDAYLLSVVPDVSSLDEDLRLAEIGRNWLSAQGRAVSAGKMGRKAKR